MNRIFSETSASSVFLRIAIEDALGEVKPFIGTNKKSADNFMANVIKHAQLFRHDGNPYYNKTAATVKNSLKSFDIKTSADLISIMLEVKAELKNDKKFPLFMSRINKIRQASNKVSKIKKYTSADGLDSERTLAIRSQFGGFPVIFYPFTGVLGKETAHQLNMLKNDYHYTTGCPYYQARPILLSTWQNLDEAHQQASSVR